MAQVYTKTGWVEDVTQTSPANLNNMEAGILLASAPIVTTLPATPVDGQECNYLADATAGVIWHFVYRSASGRWHHTGGPPLFAKVGSAETRSSSVYGDLTTVGPSLTVPLAGDYNVDIGFGGTSGAAANDALMSAAMGAVAAIDADAARANATSNYTSVTESALKVGLAAGAAIVAKYLSADGASASGFRDRWMKVTPVRVG